MNCRACGGARFGDVIDLGLMPLVNNLLDRPDQPCPRYPLKVVFCRDCSLAQLTQTPPPSEMFGEYLYFSSQSQTMVEHAADLVADRHGSGTRAGVGRETSSRNEGAGGAGTHNRRGREAVTRS